ncbi:hypothetical protein EJD97_008955 [Solanum chilense]|uniref:Uncharacterized protein n=1 Tax=Solanum chilense TaxID=4083 RepID=A0A6N2CGS5_SOLCI|nr:hypothetical protein EJD97_008955 [Solanum chilense]
MNTRWNAARRLEEEISNAGAPPRCEKVPPLEEDANVEQAPANPAPLTDDNIRTTLLQMAKDITTQAQETTTQAQAMMAQTNRETPKNSSIRSLKYFWLWGCPQVRRPSWPLINLRTWCKHEDLQEECHSSMLHDNMNIYCLMLHARRVEEARAKRKSRDAKRSRSYDGGSSKNRLEIPASLYLRSGFLIKSLSNSQKLVMIGCLVLNSRREKVLIHQMGSQIMESVMKSTMVISLRGQIIALIVEREVMSKSGGVSGIG